jgi:protein-L-isoaspartate(D-aspartate) O-methyltransferase
MDGMNGLPGEGTFDRIFSTAAYPAMPRFFAEQLVSGGMLLAPLMVEEERCIMVRLTKTGSRFEREDLFEVPFLPMQPKIAQHL